MSNKITKIHKYKEDKLHVYKRDDSRFWLCRFFVDGKYKTKTTGEENLRDARDFAETWYDDLRYNQRHGVPIHDKKFGFVADEYLGYQKTLVKNYLRSVKTGSIKKSGRVRGKYRTPRQAKDYLITYLKNILKENLAKKDITAKNNYV